jgi:hypothetical protein
LPQQNHGYGHRGCVGLARAVNYCFPKSCRPIAQPRGTKMAKPEVKMVRSTATQANREPVWEVIVDYGGGEEVVISLRAHHLTTDDALEQQRQSCEAMENLARALLDFVDRIRKQWPNDLE